MIFKRKDEGKAKKSANDNGDFAAAVQWRCAVLGIAADPDRLLPRDLVRLADYRIVVPPLDGSAVAAVIEAVTGRHPGAVDNDLARRVTLEALTIAVRSDLGAKRSLARLIRLLDNKAQNAEPAPILSELHGLGAAKDWGLALAHDLADYAAGRLPWAAVDKGCLLTGLPGTGKTSFARALAREAGVFFLATSYAQWQAHKEGHLGHVTQAIRNVFAMVPEIHRADSLAARDVAWAALDGVAAAGWGEIGYRRHQIGEAAGKLTNRLGQLFVFGAPGGAHDLANSLGNKDVRRRSVGVLLDARIVKGDHLVDLRKIVRVHRLDQKRQADDLGGVVMDIVAGEVALAAPLEIIDALEVIVDSFL
jgi:hypothetical protein